MPTSNVKVIDDVMCQLNKCRCIIKFQNKKKTEMTASDCLETMSEEEVVKEEKFTDSLASKKIYQDLHRNKM